MMAKRNRFSGKRPVDVTNAAKEALFNDNQRREEASRPVLDSKAKSIQDSFVNFQHNLGIGADNVLSSSGYGFNPITRNRPLLEWIYRGTWLGGIAVDVIADDMTKQGVDITGEIEPDSISRIEREVVNLQIWQRLNQTIKWARLYGGAIAVILIDGHDHSKPLRINTIRKDQFRGLLVLDRWMIDPSLSDLVDELGPDLGLPRHYTVTAQAPALIGLKIHHSRCIRLEGNDLPYWQRLTENLWGESILERIYDRLIGYDGATTGASQLVHKSFLRTLSIEGLREIIALGGESGDQALMGLANYVNNMRRFQTNEGVTLIDSKDELSSMESTAMSGVADVLTKFAEQLAGALQIPLVRLFGQSPSGFSTGDADLQMYYDSINQHQERQLKTGLQKVYGCIAMSKGVELGEGTEIKFKSLWQVKDTEKANMVTGLTDAIFRAEEGGLIDKAVALKELKQTSRLTGVFTNITDEMITEAENEPPPLPEMGDELEPENPNKGVEQELRLNRIQGTKDTAKVHAAGVALISEDNKSVFMVKRSDVCSDHVGDWVFPGGKIELNELPIAAAFRELKEETGLSVREPIQFDLQSFVCSNGFITYLYPGQSQIAALSHLKLNEENTQGSWFKIDQPPSNTMLECLEVFEFLKAKLSAG